MGWFGLTKSREQHSWSIRMRINVHPHGGTILVEAALPAAPGPVPVRLLNLYSFPDEPLNEMSAQLPVDVGEWLRTILEGAYPDALLQSDPSNCFDGVSFHLVVARGEEKPVSVCFQGYWGSPHETDWRLSRDVLPAVRIGWVFMGLVYDSYRSAPETPEPNWPAEFADLWKPETS